ncbi:MAG: carboxyl transferase domain-containing protein [Anaeromyxobacteraceae bacterium]
MFDRGASARRALRAVRELVRDGRAAASVAVVSQRDRAARFARDADAVVSLAGGLDPTLAAAQAGAAWLGAAPLAVRAALAEACEASGALFVGPSGAVLRRLAAPDAARALAAEAKVAAAVPGAQAGHLLEVVVARDARGGARALGPAEVSVRLAGEAALAEVPAPALSVADAEAARAVALAVAQAAGWTGVCAVRLTFDPATRALALVGVDATAESAAALEAASGVDLVRLAFALAAGGSLEAVGALQGHAVCARLLSKEPLPGARAPGRIEVLRLPANPSLVAEAEADPGEEAPSLLATVTARGATRAEALARLGEGLADADVLLRGGASSKPWVRALCAHPAVISAAGGPALAAALADPAALVPPRAESALLAVALEAYEAELDLERARFIAEARRGRPRVGPSGGRTEELRVGGERHKVRVRQIAPVTFRVSADGGRPVDVEVERVGKHERRLAWRGRRERVLVAAEGPDHLVQVDGIPHVVRRDPAGMVTSPLPAVVVAIPVAAGQRVEAGDPVARVESMKVEVVVTAPAAGVVREVLAIANGQVDAGAPLVRIDPLGEAPASAPASSLWLGGREAPEPATDVERYRAALGELRRIVLGFDVSPAEAKANAAELRELGAKVPGDDRAVIAAEEAVLLAFADVHGLFSRTRPAGGEGEATKPPLEELWRYLHEPEERGAGLSPGFVALLGAALARYGLSLEEPGRALELALLRLQRSHERADAQGGPVAALLERHIAAAPSRPEADPAERALLDRLAALGGEAFPSIGDLARELRYRRFDRPAFERIRDEAYRRVREDLALLAVASPPELDRVVERIVENPHRLASLLVAWAAQADPAVRHRAVETLLRRYYRFRTLEAVEAVPGEIPAARADYERNGRRTRVLAAHGSLAGAAAVLRRLAALAREVPAGTEVALEAYLWAGETAPAADDELAATLKAGLEAAGFAREVRRAAVTIGTAAAEPGAVPGQRHLTFQGGPAGFAEDRRYRGVHPMLFKRLQLGRLVKFDLERLPSVEDVYLYRGVAQGNPKDERLFAMAEIRDLTPVRDAAGKVVQLPHLEHMLHEALAGMRRFQARRPAHQRLEWNRVILSVAPPIDLSGEEMQGLVERLAPAAEGVGLEMVLIDARLRHPATGKLKETLVRILASERTGLSIRLDAPTDRPLEPLAEYQQRVVQLKRRGLTHPFELVKMLAPPAGSTSELPPGEFQELELAADGVTLAPVQRPPGKNPTNIVVGLVKSFTGRHPEGMLRVTLLGDPSRAMGSLAEPECRRISAALALAEKLSVPLEWFAVSAGAKISMESGTENMDWISKVLRDIIEFTQRGGEINVVVCGINVGAQPYWNAEATMLMHTRGILIMAPGSAMVLTGKEALEYSGSVSAEDNQGIGGYDRIMGPNGQAQYRAGSLAEALSILMRHYDHCYVVPGERFPRRAHSADPADRDVRTAPHGPAGGAGFETVGDLFSSEKNPDRKKPFDIRRVMAACVDQDHAPLERWRDLRGGDTAVIWDAHLGGWPVCLIGIESRPIPRLEFVPADGPGVWSAGTLFPQASKKIARALNSASGNRPAVVLANLSGFDGSPESMRRLQLEYGAEIGRAVVNFRGPVVFCVVSRYHGGAFVVFSKALREDIETAAVEGARASVIGGAPAAAVVFAREVDTRTRADPRVQEAEKAAQAGGAARLRYADVYAAVRSEKLGELGEEFDGIHSVERARKVGSLDHIIAAADLRPWLVQAVGRGIEKALKKG